MDVTMQVIKMYEEIVVKALIWSSYLPSEIS